MNVIAVRNSEGRYVIVDKDTGEILDDAQGYGFKTAEKAYKCFHYKHRSQEQKDKEKEILEWIKNHKDFISDLEDVEFYQLKEGGILNSKTRLYNFINDTLVESVRLTVYFLKTAIGNYIKSSKAWKAYSDRLPRI